MSLGRRVVECRTCMSSNLYEFLDLGFAPPADAILSKEELEEPETLFPLKVMQCDDCGLTQLRYATNPEILYGEKYRYESSITNTGRTHFHNMADSLIDRLDLKEGSFAIDIGSNVGVVLERMQERGLSVLGIDPAPKIAEIANKKGIETWESFFNQEIAEQIVRKKGRPQVITATNVFAHIDDKESLLRGVADTLLDDDGVFVVEAPYLPNLLQNLEYDTMYLDHLEYLSVKPLVTHFNQYGLEIFDVEQFDIHGTSIRVYVGKNGKRPVSENVQSFLKNELQQGIYSRSTLDSFAQRVEKQKKEFKKLLYKLKEEGNRIVGISAPAKGNTLLNYTKTGPDILDYMTEKSEIKQGHYTPGMHIPIVGDERLLQDQPEYGVVFAWNFAQEIMRNNQEYAKRGGKFIIPIPEPIIY